MYAYIGIAFNKMQCVYIYVDIYAYMYIQIYIRTRIYVFMCIYLHTGCIKMTDYQKTVPRPTELYNNNYKASQQLPGQTYKQAHLGITVFTLLCIMSCFH